MTRAGTTATAIIPSRLSASRLLLPVISSNMPRLRAVVAGLVLLAPAVPLHAQIWNDTRVTELVARATDRRARQLADTGLTDYTATALGSLTFLAQVGEGFPDPPKVVKADQIALEVYWRAPNHSKQLILGRRDTLLLPTDIQYHRDHLGIVQNNFPQIIRLGDGDEVRDVPHQLSAAGLIAYDYAISDSMRIEVPGQVIEVYEVRVRPRDAGAPAAVGAVYLARADAQVVRMAFSFTRAALLDQQLDDVSIVLDNALIEERFWLPRRQEIEIRRSGTWLDFPARGIIRGGFEVCCYRINGGTPIARFTGPEIELAPPERRAAYAFPKPLRDAVPPDVATTSGEELARVQARALELVGQAALERTRRGALVAGSVSDVLRFNRAQGLSLGTGMRRQLGGALDLTVTGRYGVADRKPTGTVRVAWGSRTATSVRFGAFDEVRDASDVVETSGIRNSIGAQEFAADFTEPYRVRGFDARLERRFGPGVVASLGLAREWNSSAPLRAFPARGSFRPTPAVLDVDGWRGEASLLVGWRPLLGGSIQGAVTAQVRRIHDPAVVGTPSRVTARFEFERRLGLGTLVSSSFAGVTGSPLTQDSLRAGGPISAPGYHAHEFTTGGLWSQRLEWQLPVAFPSIPLGRWGRSPARATLAPLVSVLLIDERHHSGNRRAVGYASAGVGLMTFFDLIRFDVARGMRNGRWNFGVDISRDLWRIL
jgi:hypothetical protein